MKISLDKQEKYTLLKLDEEKLDSSYAPDLKSEFVKLHAEGAKNLIIDLSAVKYSDSSGLSSLLVGNRVFNESGGAFVLCGISEHVMKLISISMLDKVLDILPTVQESIDAVFMHEIESDLKSGAEGEE
ncbi:MAG: STAS domain-containing protein [bacterium]|jgi:anti-sigma B factor antagonist|nr:STAS domain-containing protein [bacterium]